VRERILRAAGGNPLFVEEMAAMVQASDDSEVAVPPTLQALLTARLDQLDPPERSVLERGAVEGEVFHHGVVQALTPEEPRLTLRFALTEQQDRCRESERVEGDRRGVSRARGMCAGWRAAATCSRGKIPCKTWHSAARRRAELRRV
jgi:hypothetical protein